MSEFLVCKKCGYKDFYEPTVRAFKNRFKGKGLSTHDIPYFCGACQDNASDEEYYLMEAQMNGKTEYLICNSCGRMITDGRTINSYKKKFPNVKDISKVPYRCKSCESVYGQLN